MADQGAIVNPESARNLPKQVTSGIGWFMSGSWINYHSRSRTVLCSYMKFRVSILFVCCFYVGLRWERNTGGKALGKIQSSDRSPFQVQGPTRENARLCLVKVHSHCILLNRTRRIPCWDKQNDRKLIGEDNRAHEGRQEQGQITSTRPRKRFYMKFMWMKLGCENLWGLYRSWWGLYKIYLNEVGLRGPMGDYVDVSPLNDELSQICCK